MILSLDWVDLAGALGNAYGDGEIAAKVIIASLDHQLHNGWSMDYQGLPPADVFIAADSDAAVAALCAQLPPAARRIGAKPWPDMTFAPGPITVPQMAHDVTTFLAWASEPTLDARHRVGVRVFLFLIVGVGIFYAAKRKIWASVH